MELSRFRFFTQWKFKHCFQSSECLSHCVDSPCRVFASAVSSEVGRAVWLRFSPPLPSSGPQPSFMAHLSGAVVGISMGLLILRSYEESLQKQCSWWVIVFSFITFLLFAIFWNIFAYELLGVQIPPPPWWRPTSTLDPLAWPSPTLDPISYTLNMFTDSKQMLFFPTKSKTSKRKEKKNAICASSSIQMWKLIISIKQSTTNPFLQVLCKSKEICLFY